MCRYRRELYDIRSERHQDQRRQGMFIKQADIFWGLDKGFIKNLMELSVKETHDRGTILFDEGTQADRFFILLKGNIRLGFGEDMDVIYNVTHAGEAFGWSGLVERDVYSTTAECTTDTILLRFDVSEVKDVVERHPLHGMMFYKKLAGMLGNRLIHTYQMSASWFHNTSKASYGSGKMLESEMMP